MENKKVELLKPKCDIVFQALFAENKYNITQSLISDILGEKVEIIDIKTEQLKAGDEYKDLKKTIGIVITNYEIKELEGIEELDSKWQIKCDKNDKRILTDDLELRIIEIPKADKILKNDKYNKIAQWLTFFDNPNTERVEEIMKENEEVKKANSVLHEMSEDEELQRLAELREKWDLDERSALGHAKDEGIKEGEKLGLEKGKIEIAKKMKAEKLELEIIMKMTELTKEEIEKL